MRIVIAALATVLTLTDAGATELVPAEGGTIEQQMAVENAGHPVPVDDITIARFRYLLSSIQQASGVNRVSIALLLMKVKRDRPNPVRQGRQLAAVGRERAPPPG